MEENVLRIACSNGHKMRVTAPRPGSKIRCPKCQAVVVIPAAREDPEMVVPAKPARLLAESVGLPKKTCRRIRLIIGLSGLLVWLLGCSFILSPLLALATTALFGRGDASSFGLMAGMIVGLLGMPLGFIVARRSVPADDALFPSQPPQWILRFCGACGVVIGALMGAVLLGAGGFRLFGENGCVALPFALIGFLVGGGSGWTAGQKSAWSLWSIKAGEQDE